MGSEPSLFQDDLQASDKQSGFKEDPLQYVYTPPLEAKEEIWKRWNDHALRQEVEAFLGEVPLDMQKEPRAVLFRQLMTPNYECTQFLDSARALQLKPLGWEYLEDIFLTINKDKAYLGKMRFRSQPINGNGIRHRRVIRLNENEKRKFTEIKTLWGENFVDFHHRILTQRITGLQLFDASQWYASKGGKAKEYYEYFMALFICHGILFENFITDEREREFSLSVVEPSIDKIENRFGIKPLIIQLSLENERCYPADMEDEVLRYLSEGRRKGSSGHYHNINGFKTLDD